MLLTETSTGFPGARGMRQGIEDGQTHVLGVGDLRKDSDQLLQFTDIS